MMWKAFRVATMVTSAMAAFTWCAAAWAYNPPTHQWLVEQAIDYIKASGTPAQKAALQQLANAVGSEQQVRTLLGQEAYNTDYYRDTVFYANSWIGQGVGGYTRAYRIENSYFTRLNHFLNARRPSALWRNQEGYYYQWSSKAGKDYEAMASDKVSFLDVEVDNGFSLFLERYRTHFKGGPNQWSENWAFHSRPGGDDWDIADTRFAPVSALAYYWYRRYVNFPREWARTGIPWIGQGEVLPVSKIIGIQLLGPALHAAGDVTVPQHTLGAMGLEHIMYEDWFQEYHEIYRAIGRDNALIQAHLNRDFLRIGRAPVPSQVQTLQVTTVTGDVDGAGTDATILFDIGSRSWNLDTDMDDFERGNDDVFTLPAQGLRVQDFQRIQIRHNGGGSRWYLKAVYVVVNGVLLYGNDHVNTWLDRGQHWTASDFQPRTTLTQQIWPIDAVMEAAAGYVIDYMRTEGRAGDNPWDRNFWEHVFFSWNNFERMLQNMQHLLNLAIALIVRTIEMSQQERGLTVPVFPAGTFGVVGVTRPAAPSVTKLPTYSLTRLISPQGMARLSASQRQAADQSIGRIRNTLAARTGQIPAVIAAGLATEEDALATNLRPAVEFRRVPPRQKMREPKPNPADFATAASSPELSAEWKGQFRKRTPEEARDPKRSEQYYREAKEFEKQQALTELTVARAMVKAALPKVTDPHDRARLEKKLRDWESHRNRLLSN